MTLESNKHLDSLSHLFLLNRSHCRAHVFISVVLVKQSTGNRKQSPYVSIKKGTLWRTCVLHVTLWAVIAAGCHGSKNVCTCITLTRNE